MMGVLSTPPLSSLPPATDVPPETPPPPCDALIIFAVLSLNARLLLSLLKESKHIAYQAFL